MEREEGDKWKYCDIVLLKGIGQMKGGTALGVGEARERRVEGKVFSEGKGNIILGTGLDNRRKEGLC